MRFRPVIFFSIILFTAPAIQADGIPVEPGLWEMTTTVNLPILPQPKVSTVTECMTDSEFDMDDVASDGSENDCTFNMGEVDGSTMKWTVDCPVEGGSSHGEWEATSSGDSVTGNGKMTMSFQGQTMEMTMSWEGKRIGECAAQ
jgi:hypothetical protein